MTHATSRQGLSLDHLDEPNFDTGYYAPIQLPSQKRWALKDSSASALAGGLIFSLAMTLLLIVSR